MIFFSDIKNGKLAPHISEQIKEHLLKLEGKFVAIEIWEYSPKRSNALNKLLHATFKMIAKYLRDKLKQEGNPEYTKIDADTIKAWSKLKFLGKAKMNIMGKEIEWVRSTADLTNQEASDFFKQLQIYWGERGLYIPDPEEFKQNRGKYDKI